MKKIAFILFVALAIYACSGGGEDLNTSGSLARPALNSTIDLRLGQLSSNSSPVAVSAALENGESITAFTTTGDNLAEYFDAIYVGPSSQTLLVNLNTNGRPKFVQFQNITITYTNYTKENTVDIAIQIGDSARTAKNIFLANQPIEQSALDYLNSDAFLRILLGIDQDIDSGRRAILAAVVGALKLIGCNSEEGKETLRDIIPEELIPALCTSDLLKAIEDILEFSNYQAITVNLTNRHPECDNPESFEQLEACALVIWDELTDAAEQGVVGDFPKTTNSDGGSGSTGGSSTTGGTSSGGVGTNSGGTSVGGTGTNSGGNNGGGGAAFLGNWSGGGGGSPPNCAGTTFNATFTIVASGDNTCTIASCLITGMLMGNSPPTFPIMGTVPLTGSVSVGINGAQATFQAFGALSNSTFTITTTIMNDNAMNGGFFVTPGGCAGQFSFRKL